MNDKKIIKQKAQELRYEGKTYTEICSILNFSVPKGTLSYWCSDIHLSDKQKERIKGIMQKNAARGRIKAVLKNKQTREQYLQRIYQKNHNLLRLVQQNTDISKIVLAMLYLGEGAKKQRGSLMFGNADPKVVALFLSLLRSCYVIDENKFRCTVQCRADQNISELEKFWSNVTKIPFNKFYKTQVDLRTIGKPSKNKMYKGVCRIDYFSAEIFIELMYIAKIICEGI